MHIYAAACPSLITYKINFIIDEPEEDEEEIDESKRLNLSNIESIIIMCD